MIIAVFSHSVKQFLFFCFWIFMGSLFVFFIFLRNQGMILLFVTVNFFCRKRCSSLSHSAFLCFTHSAQLRNHFEWLLIPGFFCIFTMITKQVQIALCMDCPKMVQGNWKSFYIRFIRCIAIIFFGNVVFPAFDFFFRFCFGKCGTFMARLPSTLPFVFFLPL